MSNFIHGCTCELHWGEKRMMVDVEVACDDKSFVVFVCPKIST